MMRPRGDGLKFGETVGAGREARDDAEDAKQAEIERRKEVERERDRIAPCI